jgi:hypothetical protein
MAASELQLKEDAPAPLDPGALLHAGGVPQWVHQAGRQQGRAGREAAASTCQWCGGEGPGHQLFK